MIVAASHRRLFLLGLAVASLHCSAQIYTSPAGSDANPGSQARPVQTLERAITLARNQASVGSKDVTITLAGGTYRLTRPLQLDANDSGRNGKNLVFTTKAGEHPVLSGAVRI